jgi:hypothetical protein
MLLPKEPQCYEKAVCTMRDFHQMLEEFNLEGFSGYALLDFVDFQYAVLLEKGTPVRVVKFGKDTTACSDMQAVDRQLKGNSTYLIVVELPWFSVDQMVRILSYSPVYENLLTDFVDFQKLLENIEKMRFNGIMELGIGNRVHFLVFKFGIPQFSVLQYSSALRRESVEDLITMVERKGALINFYVPTDANLVEAFKILGNGLLDRYAELSGKRLATYVEHEMNAFLRQHENIIILTGGHYITSKVPDDFREQECIFKEILFREVDILQKSIGRRTTERIYGCLLQSVDENVREIFREVVPCTK